MTTGIKNLDRNEVVENKEGQIKALQAAFESADPKEVAEKIVTNYENNMLHFQDMMNTTIREANRANEQKWDDAVLAQRGVRALTTRSEEHTSELQSRENLVCRLLLEK